MDIRSGDQIEEPQSEFQDKLDWLKEVGAKEFEHPMKWSVGPNYLLPEDYVKNTPLENIKEGYEGTIRYTNKNESVQSLGQILDRYNHISEEIARDIILVLKRDCKTYAELQGNLARFEKSTFWDIQTKEEVVPLFYRLSRFVQKEMSDLPITNRS